MEKSWRSFFKGKKVTQLGLGLLGRGVRDAAFLAKYGVELIVTDKKDADALAPSLKRLSRYGKRITYRLGGHTAADFRGRDFILKAAGVPLDSPEIAAARENGIPIEMDASLFAKLAPPGVVLVGVTGTRGKSTTAHLIFHILKATRRRAFLAGNVIDTATLPLLEMVRPGDIVVLELDSWQLQGFGESRVSPHVSVFTTFMDDHLQYYKGDRDAYFADKANIFGYQKPGDVLIVGEQAAARVSAARPHVAPSIACTADVPVAWKTKLVGAHNRANIACAIAAARALSVPQNVIRRAAASFSGVPGRLELVATKRGVRFFNDTTATTPAAAAAGLAALSTGKGTHTILICGGSDKGIDPSPMVSAIGQFARAVILLPGSGTESLQHVARKKDAFKKALPEVYEAASMHAAVAQAHLLAKKGDAVLLSPGFASFGPPPGGFKNEFDRGAQFLQAVRKL